MELGLIAARALHYTAAISLVGAIGFVALVAPPALAEAMAAPRLYRQIAMIGWLSLGAALVAAAAWLFFTAAAMSGAALVSSAAFPAVVTVLTSTQFGEVWLLRLGLAALLIPFLARLGRHRYGDGIALAVGAIWVGAIAWQGHAGTETGVAGLVHGLGDATHLVAASLWLGALLPLALLLDVASRKDTARGAIAAADIATQRFSTLGIAVVAALLVSGIINFEFLVGSVPALIGTPYGHILLVKLGLFLAALVLAAINRYRLAPRLARAPKISRAAIVQLRRNALVEALIGLAIVVIVGWLGILVPAAHQAPWWPFPYRFGLDAMSDPNLRQDAIGTAALAMSGLALLAIGIYRRRALPIVTGLVLALGLGWRPIQLLLLPATPTSYVSAVVPFTVSSIGAGAKIYAANCVSCHGEGGLGDGPMAAELAIAPADLTAPHLFFHTDGDLYWFVTAGLDGGQMPGFADRLDDTERWDLINFIKARAAGIVFSVNPKVSADPAPLAPDFTFAAAADAPGSLRAVLSQAAVLLVLAEADVPPRVAFESERSVLAESGITVLASADPALRSVFALYDSTPPTEAPVPVAYLIDRNGYIRARWHPDDNPDWLNIALLNQEIAAMSRLQLRATTAAAAHIH